MSKIFLLCEFSAVAVDSLSSGGVVDLNIAVMNLKTLFSSCSIFWLMYCSIWSCNTEMASSRSGFCGAFEILDAYVVGVIVCVCVCVCICFKAREVFSCVFARFF